MKNEELELACLALEQALPVDPFEVRPLSSRLSVNVGKIALAVNRRDVPVVQEMRHSMEIMALIGARYDAKVEYPEVPPTMRAFALSPVLVVRDELGGELLLDGGLRAKLQLQVNDSLKVFRISLADALRVGAEGNPSIKTFQALSDRPEPSWCSGDDLMRGNGLCRKRPKRLKTDQIRKF